MTVPYTFKNAVGTIPLSQLDDNFAAVVDTTSLASATGATSVGFSPTGTIVATTVQTAIAETNTDLIAGLALKTNISDLAATTGTALVGTAVTDSTILRVLSSKLEDDSVSVMDFIPPGTNTATTDCAAWIQAALDTGRNVTFPGQIFSIGTSLIVTSQTVSGAGTIVNYGQTQIQPSGNFPCFINKKVRFVSFKIENFYIVYGSTAPTNVVTSGLKYGFYITDLVNYPEFYNISNCTVKAGWGALYDQGGSYQSIIRNVFSQDCRYGFTKIGGTTILFDTCFHIGGISGFRITDTLSPTLLNCACDGTTPIDVDVSSNIFTNIKSLTIQGWDGENNIISGHTTSYMYFTACTVHLSGFVGFSNKLVCDVSQDVYFIRISSSIVNIDAFHAARSVGDLAFNGTAGRCYTIAATTNSKVFISASSILSPTIGTGTPTTSYSTIGTTGSSIKITQSNSDGAIAGTEQIASSISSTLTPTNTGFTITGGTATATFGMSYSKTGNIICATITITPGSGASVASTAGTSLINFSSIGTVYLPTDRAVCGTALANALASLGNGIVNVFGVCYPPTFTATTAPIVINFTYQTSV